MGMPGGLWTKSGQCSLSNFSYTADISNQITDFNFSNLNLENGDESTNEHEQIIEKMKQYLLYLPIFNESLSGNGLSQTNLYSSKLNNLKDVTSLYDTGHD